MSKGKKYFSRRTASLDDKNKEYVLIDSVGKKHVLTAGKDGVTERWIEIMRNDDFEELSSNYRYYFKWDGRNYEQRVFSSNDIPLEELEEYPSMAISEDAPALLIAREEREIFIQKYCAAMQSLTPEQKQLIHKRVNLKMSDVEIACQEGVSAVAIHYRWEYLRKKMVKFFE